MRPVTRRRLLHGIAGLSVIGGSTGAYAVAVEPRFRLVVTAYALTPARWTPGLKLRLVVLADLHGREPNMGEARLKHVVDVANGLGGDMILLLGDYAQRIEPENRYLSFRHVLGIMTGLKAPLGVHGVLGNHEWWDDPGVRRAGAGPTEAHRIFADLGLPLLENRAVRLEKNQKPFWLAGLGDQLAFRIGHSRFRGVDDLPGTLAQLTDDAPAILMAHEPDIFPKVPARVALTLSGHTHGGQVRLFGFSPVVPSKFGNRFAYGHIVEENRHLIVSGGLGTVSAGLAPVRLGVPPEIVVVDLG